MGGTGSGRTRKNQSPSSFLKIDVRRLQREGALGQGAPFMWQWTLNGRSTGHAYAANKGASLSIDYGFRTTGGVWKQSNFVLSQPFPAKPKGMHSWRYTKLGLRALRAEAQYDADICRWVDSIRRHRTNQ